MIPTENNKKNDSIIVDKPKAVLKSYSALTLLANIPISLSTVGFTALGALSKLDMMYLVTIMSVLSIIGFIGRFIIQDISGTEKEGPVGFKGVTIRFVWFVSNFVKSKYRSIVDTFKGWFGK